MSTSNHLISDVVEVETSESVVFTVEIRRESQVACYVGEEEREFCTPPLLHAGTV